MFLHVVFLFLFFDKNFFACNRLVILSILLAAELAAPTFSSWPTTKPSVQDAVLHSAARSGCESSPPSSWFSTLRPGATHASPSTASSGSATLLLRRLVHSASPPPPPLPHRASAWPGCSSAPCS